MPHQPQTPASHIGTLIRSRSIPCLKYENEDAQGGTKFSFVSSLQQAERTPVNNFCTPSQSDSGQLKSGEHSKSTHVSQKQLSDQHHRTPSKYFRAEANLRKVTSTPEYFNKIHMETPRSKFEPEDLPVLLGEETSNLTVGVRVRPLIMRERNDTAVVSVVSVDGCEIKVVCESGVSYRFTYDHCFWSCDPRHPRYASQDVIFTTMVQPLIDKAFLGYNACLFAYGQTGSGKSYRFVYVMTEIIVVSIILFLRNWMSHKIHRFVLSL